MKGFLAVVLLLCTAGVSWLDSDAQEVKNAEGMCLSSLGLITECVSSLQVFSFEAGNRCCQPQSISYFKNPDTLFGCFDTSLECTASPTRSWFALNSLFSIAPKEPHSSSAIVAPMIQHDGKPQNIQWKPLVRESLLYLTIMHSYRMATEQKTREALGDSVFGGYFKALGSMHGWSDGDGYFENYLGHPIQGSVSANLWIGNDPRYSSAEFGKSRDYWMGRLRAYAFAWAYSEQFEIGPFSEASLGQIQRHCCAYGFVDHVITPNTGIAWLIGEDVIDKYVVRKIEDHTRNKTLRAIARVSLNPTRSFANAISRRAPWYRTTRPGIREYDREAYARVESQPKRSQTPIFQLASSPTLFSSGDLLCRGGTGTAAFRLSDTWQWTVDVGGCRIHGLPENWSGGSMTFTTGPQWSMETASHWTPHAHMRFGGGKVTEEYVDPELKSSVLNALPPKGNKNEAHSQYAKDYETTGLSLAMGGGLDYRVNQVVALRVLNFDYQRSWINPINRDDFSRGFRFGSGVVLRVGTW